jgi:hypothetical protein
VFTSPVRDAFCWKTLLEVLKRSLKKGEKLGRGSVNDLIAC